MGQRDRTQHLELLGLDRLGGELDRLLHRGEREQLQQVVLQDVAGSARLVIERGAPRDADVLGHRDLHRVDEVGVEDRLEQLVGEPQRHQVLDGLLAQVVVDPEHVGSGEHIVDELVELERTFQVMPERLLHHDAPPAACGSIVGQFGALHLIEDGREHRRWDGQVERGIALDPVRAAQVIKGVLQRVEGLVVVERARDEPDVAGQPLPDVFFPVCAGVLLGCLLRQLLEITIAPVAAGEAEQHEVGREQAAVGQVVDRREQFLARQVTGDPEDHQRTRCRHSGQAAVASLAQRVGVETSRREADSGMLRRRRRVRRRRGGWIRLSDRLTRALFSHAISFGPTTADSIMSRRRPAGSARSRRAARRSPRTSARPRSRVPR